MSNWTSEQDARLRELKAAGFSYPQIGADLGRSPKAIACRWRYINLSPAQMREELDKKNHYKAERRSPPKKRNIQFVPNQAAPIVVPDEVLFDRDARARAPRSLTAWFMGDPAPGWSSLDRRVAA